MNKRREAFKALTEALIGGKYSERQKRSLCRQYFDRFMKADMQMKDKDWKKHAAGMFSQYGGDVEDYLFEDWEDK